MAPRLARPSKLIRATSSPFRPSSLLLPQSQRTIMSSGPKMREFLVIVPDKPGVKDKRLEVRTTHLQNMTPRVESGDWKMGGALLNSVPEGDDPATFDFMGSTIVCKAETKEQVLEQLKNDVYVTSGVWDLDKIQIYPLLCAFRKP